MSKFLAIFLVASVCCLASAESLRNQTDLVLDREKQVNISMFLSDLKSNLLIPFNAIEYILRDPEWAQVEESVKGVLSATKNHLENRCDYLKEYIDKLEQELSTGTRIQPQL
jgi:hypothetical protein